MKRILLPIFAGLLVIPLTLSVSPMVSATRYCVSDRCKAAEKELSAATSAAEAAKDNVDSLEAEIAKLQSEARVMQAKIEANEEIKADLVTKIAETEAELDSQQNALAQMLVELHYAKDSDPLTLLAGSDSLSDYAEQEARANTLKEQISVSAGEVLKTKEELESQKVQVETLIEDQEGQKADIEANKAEQTALKEKYAADYDSYKSAASDAKKTMAEEIAKQTARYNGTGVVVASGTNSYPYQSRCPQENWAFTGRYIYGYGGYICECTSYAGYKAYERWGVTINSWGNARYWGGSATRAGYRVDSTPAPYTVGYSTSGSYGHVVWVEAVNSDGTVDISEYNNPYSSVSGSRADYGYRASVPASSYRYIHFN